ncbi:hypothetical protein EDD86DRAFT_2490 [Gorgonomyces haynaldii]|nr:hypothetical protein EDD86DRAFT_2490 [Gorgonomyces haynaldii]
MLETLTASLSWSVTGFSRLNARVVSPTFGPPDHLWEVSLYPEGSGTTRGTHVGLYLDCVRSQKETNDPQWKRPIMMFRLAIHRSGSQQFLVVKERFPQNQEGFGEGFSHPKSWGWATMLSIAQLSEALLDDTLTIYAQVMWHQSTSLVGLISQAGVLDTRESPLLFSEWMSDVIFVCRQPPVDVKRDLSEGMRRTSIGSSGESLAQDPILLSDHTTIHAHRAILASHSDYFAAMFRSGCQEGTGHITRIEIQDFDAQDIQYMLEFIYNGKLNEQPTTFQKRCKLLELADRYQLPTLYSTIGTMIMDQDVTLETCLDVLELAQLFSSTSTQLKYACLGFVRSHLETLKSSPVFQNWVKTTEQRELVVDLFTLL